MLSALAASVKPPYTRVVRPPGGVTLYALHTLKPPLIALKFSRTSEEPTKHEMLTAGNGLGSIEGHGFGAGLLDGSGTQLPAEAELQLLVAHTNVSR